MKVEVKIGVFLTLLMFPLIPLVKEVEGLNSFPYQEGWPVIEEKSPYSISQAINVADVNGDGKIEVFLPIFDGVAKVFAWTYDGSALPGWPLVLEGANIRGVTIGSLLNDTGLEVTFITEVSSSLSLVHIFRYDGQEFTGGGNWPKSVDGQASKGPVLEDIDNDLQFEVLVGVGRKVYAWNIDGSNVPGFPVTLDTGSIAITGIAVGDLDNDRNKEIVAASMTFAQKRMFVISNTGSIIYSWSPVADIVASEHNPILADLNGDYKREIIITSYSEVLVYLFNGAELWKRQVQSDVSSPAVGDINMDGYLEIVACDITKIYAWDRNGYLLPNWPVEVPNVTWTGGGNLRNANSVAIGNIDVSRKLEIVLNGYKTDTGSWVIFAFKSDGSVVTGFPIKENTIHYVPTGTPVLTDIDRDGDVEIISYAEDHNHGPYLAYFKVVVYDLPYPYLLNRIPWPMFQQNPRRTGCCYLVAGLAVPSIVNALLGPGTSFTVDILVNNVAYLTNAVINLHYNASMLTATTAGYRLVSPVIFETDSVTIDNVNGNVNMTGHRRTTSVPPYLNTTFNLPLAFIKFTVKDRGTTTLDLHDTVLTDYYGMTITHDEIDGFFDNRLQGTMSVPHIVNTTLSPGDYFDVYVSVGPWMGKPVERLWGFQFIMDFDPNIAVPVDFETLGIFMPGPSEIGADYVAVTGNSYYGDPNGLTTSVPVEVARIGFVKNNAGVTLLTLHDTAMVDVNGDPMIHETISGSFTNTMNVSVSLNTIFVEKRKWSTDTDGELYPLSVQVTNTGDGITKTRAVFDVYSGGILVAHMETDAVDINPGTTIRLDTELNVGSLNKPASYDVIGTVEYINYLGTWVRGRKGSPTGARTLMVKTFTLYP